MVMLIIFLPAAVGDDDFVNKTTNARPIKIPTTKLRAEKLSSTVRLGAMLLNKYFNFF